MNEDIILPNRDEMLKRLLKANDNPYLEERFYPVLLKQAGQKLSARGVVAVLVVSIEEYVKDMPDALTRLTYMQAPDFIDALISDAETAKEAKDVLKAFLPLLT